jgi:hypothetical protein
VRNRSIGRSFYPKNLQHLATRARGDVGVRFEFHHATFGPAWLERSTRQELFPDGCGL